MEIPFHGVAGDVHRQCDEPFHVAGPPAHVGLVGFRQRERGAVPVRLGGGNDIEVPRESQSSVMFVTAACGGGPAVDMCDDVDLLPIGAGQANDLDAWIVQIAADEIGDGEVAMGAD